MNAGGSAASAETDTGSPGEETHAQALRPSRNHNARANSGRGSHLHEEDVALASCSFSLNNLAKKLDSLRIGTMILF
jgi:hypothetical protein